MSTSTPLTPCAPGSFPEPGVESRSRSCMDPAEAFPDALHTLSMSELQVLHSRICRQLDHEFLSVFEGPHPSTADRLHELLAELDARDAA